MNFFDKLYILDLDLDLDLDIDLDLFPHAEYARDMTTVSAPLPVPIIDSLQPVVEQKRALLVDIWGVMHNGVRPYLHAAEACTAFRKEGGHVLLLSNSPRPTPSVLEQLKKIGVPFTAFDSVLTSGDAAILLIQKSSKQGQKLGHIGPERDLGLFMSLKEKLVPLLEAQTVVCSGLFDDEHERPENYETLFRQLVSRGARMICANPDITVDRGGKIIYCAGALAQTYEALGGKVDYVGKPFLPIYSLAFERLTQLRQGQKIAPSDVLAIGDGIETDIAGAKIAGIQSIFIASGLHLGGSAQLEAYLLEDLFCKKGQRPIAAMKELRW